MNKNSRMKEDASEKGIGISKEYRHTSKQCVQGVEVSNSRGALRRRYDLRVRHDADQSIHQGDLRVFSVKYRMIILNISTVRPWCRSCCWKCKFWWWWWWWWVKTAKPVESEREKEREGRSRSTYLRWPVLNLEMSPYLATCWVPVRPDRMLIHYLDSSSIPFPRRGANFESSSFFLSSSQKKTQ